MKNFRSSGEHIRLRPDQMHIDCLVRVKGNDASKHFSAKLLRNGLEPGLRERSPVGRPYFDYKIIVNSRSSYAKLMKVVDSTDDVELVVDE